MRRILVTGGGTGIGARIAKDFAAQGQQVTITGRREEPLRETAQGSDIKWRVADVTDEADVTALFAQPFDTVIANAGTGTAGTVAKLSLDEWERTIRVNLTGTFLTFRAALQSMETGGRLIAIASTASLQGGPNIAAYVAAKHGVLGLVRSLAHEVARKGITCNAVCPGFVDTAIADQAVSSLAERRGLSLEDAETRIVSGNPMKRMIDVGEVSAAVLFLASDGAAMVNGHALAVSGGEI